MHVWYAAYGSNLSRARFDVYLNGGHPDGATHIYPGCRDTSAPIDDVVKDMQLELVFGGASRTWGGGVAFVEPGGGATPTKMRYYLITLQQFEDVVAQENWLEPGSVDLDEIPFTGSLVLDGDHTYGTIMCLIELHDIPVLTVTQLLGTEQAKPSPAYLRHMADGLRESHKLTDLEIVRYLGSKRGVCGALSDEELAELLGSPI